MQVLTKIEATGLALTEAGMELLLMAQDGRIDEEEAARLPDLACAILSRANEVEDISEDIEWAVAGLRHGRHSVPNKHRAKRSAAIDAVLRRQEKAPTPLQGVEAYAVRAVEGS